MAGGQWVPVKRYVQHSASIGPGSRFRVKAKGSTLAGRVFVCDHIASNVIQTGYDNFLNLGDLVVFKAHFKGRGLKGPELHAVPLDWCEMVDKEAGDER